MQQLFTKNCVCKFCNNQFYILLIQKKFMKLSVKTFILQYKL